MRAASCFTPTTRAAKPHDLHDNPFAALVFYWQPLSRQVRVEGPVERVAPDESDALFCQPSEGTSAEAHASAQSQVVRDRDFLQKQFEGLSGRSPARTCRDLRTGAATGWCPKASSSGRKAKIGCTTGCVTGATCGQLGDRAFGTLGAGAGLRQRLGADWQGGGWGLVL